MKLKSGFIVPGERWHLIWCKSDGYARSMEWELWEDHQFSVHDRNAMEAVAKGLREAGFTVRIVVERRETEEAS